MIASATRLEISGLGGWIRFFLHIVRVNRQLRQPEGLVHRELKGLRTLTVWQDKGSMRAFRNGGAHLEAMRAAPRIGRATSVSWPVDAIPTWQEAQARYHQKFPPSA